HCGRLSMLMPSAKHPPGHRTNAGSRPAMSSARSGRRPFRRFFQVFCGKSDTKSSQTRPVDPNVSARRACGSVPDAVSVVEYFVQDAPGAPVTRADARTVPDALSKDAVIGPPKL